MKRLRNRLLLIIIVVFMSNPLWAKIATVTQWDTPMFEAVGSTNIVVKLPIAMTFKIEKSEDRYFYTTIGEKKGWVEKRSVRVYEEVFCNLGSKVILSPKIVSEGGEWFLYYYFNKRMVKYNIMDKKEASSKSIVNISDIRVTPRNDLFFLEGVTTNMDEVHNLSLYNYSSGNMTYLGSFGAKRIKVLNIDFSKNVQYLSVQYLVEEKFNVVAVYRLDNGEMIGAARGIQNPVWYGQSLILNDKKKIWAVDVSRQISNFSLEYRAELEITNIPKDWSVAGNMDCKVEGDSLYINTAKGVIEMNIASRAIKETPFRSLVWNSIQTLNYYMSGGSANMKNVLTAKTYAVFNGSDPKIDFISFCGDKIIGKGKFEKIDALFLYSEEGNEIYRYRAIDEPLAIAENGILADLDSEKGMHLISVEIPSKNMFYFILNKENP